MSSFTGESVQSDSLLIASGIATWLDDERQASIIDQNRYLDRIGEQRPLMALPIDDSASQFFIKLYSHIQRLPLWFDAFAEDPTNDYQTGKMIFSPLMFLSGTYRERFIFQSKSQGDYYVRKTAKPSNLIKGLSEIVGVYTLASQNREVSLTSLRSTAEFCVRTALEEAKILNDRAANGEDFGQEESIAVDSTMVREFSWMGFTLDLISFARQQRGDEIASVPFLEGKSISDDPQVYYPFAA
ncbi:MAG TPA: hypothetical protein VIH90_07570 [Candidatus Saccharimonadales bacterium]